MLAMSTEMVGTLVLAGGALLGFAFATAARRQDHKTFVLARAPGLPIRSLSAHDDAWLRGVVHPHGSLLRCPWFDLDCVAFSYQRERKHTITEKDSDGKTRTRTEWRTETSESEAVAFELDDGQRIVVDLPAGSNEAMRSTGYDHEWSDVRHSAQVLEPGTEVSVLGVKRDDGTFGPLAEVPLLVTRQLREQRVKSSASSENWLLFFAMFFPFAGLTVGSALWTGAQDLPGWLLAAAIGLLVLVPQWWLLTHNRLVRLRQQVRATQQQIAIELAQRTTLVPNLLEVVKGYAGHEQELLTKLTAIRSGGDVDSKVRGEVAAVAATRSMLLLHERHPDLKSDASYRDLHDRLWAIEEKIAHARSMYNDVVSEWNTRLEQFPSSFVASVSGCKPAALFAAECEEARPPRLG
ncbi:MAG: LemA family protein [Planctomycetota bacterium]